MLSTFENNPTNPHKTREKPKNRTELFTGHIAQIASEINQEMKDNYGIEYFLKADGSINMQSYAVRNSFKFGELAADERKIREREEEWSGIANENRRAYYHDKYGATTDDEIIEAHKREQSSGKNKKMEMIAQSVLYKVLKEKFIVVHSSVYDDYFNGIDNILVNRETGDVICALDEVHDHNNSDRKDEKMEKIKRNAKSGGKSLNYGFTFEDGNMIEQKICGLPIFLLSLKTDEIDAAFSGISLETRGAPNKMEMDVMKKFIEGLYLQLALLEKERLPEIVKNNLKKFRGSLKDIEEITKEHEEKKEKPLE